MRASFAKDNMRLNYVESITSGDIVYTRGGRPPFGPENHMTRGFLLILSAATLVSAQDTTKKQLTARELFYAAAQAPAPAPRSRPPAKTAPRTTPTPPKPADVARADTHAQTSPPDSTAPTPAAAPATAPMPSSGAPPLGLRYTVLKLAADNSAAEVSPDTVFHSGDRIRFAIQANAPRHL